MDRIFTSRKPVEDVLEKTKEIKQYIKENFSENFLIDYTIHKCPNIDHELYLNISFFKKDSKTFLGKPIDKSTYTTNDTELFETFSRKILNLIQQKKMNLVFFLKIVEVFNYYYPFNDTEIKNIEKFWDTIYENELQKENRTPTLFSTFIRKIKKYIFSKSLKKEMFYYLSVNEEIEQGTVLNLEKKDLFDFFEQKPRNIIDYFKSDEKKIYLKDKNKIPKNIPISNIYITDQQILKQRDFLSRVYTKILKTNNENEMMNELLKLKTKKKNKFEQSVLDYESSSFFLMEFKKMFDYHNLSMYLQNMSSKYTMTIEEEDSELLEPILSSNIIKCSKQDSYCKTNGSTNGIYNLLMNSYDIITGILGFFLVGRSFTIKKSIDYIKYYLIAKFVLHTIYQFNKTKYNINIIFHKKAFDYRELVNLNNQSDSFNMDSIKKEVQRMNTNINDILGLSDSRMLLETKTEQEKLTIEFDQSLNTIIDVEEILKNILSLYDYTPKYYKENIKNKSNISKQTLIKLKYIFQEDLNKVKKQLMEQQDKFSIFKIRKTIWKIKKQDDKIKFIIYTGQPLLYPKVKAILNQQANYIQTGDILKKTQIIPIDHKDDYLKEINEYILFLKQTNFYRNRNNQQKNQIKHFLKENYDQGLSLERFMSEFTFSDDGEKKSLQNELNAITRDRRITLFRMKIVEIKSS